MMADRLPADITPEALTHEILTSIEFRFDGATGEPLGVFARAVFGVMSDDEPPRFLRRRIVDMAFDKATAVANLSSAEIQAVLSIRNKLKQYARTKA
jgi:hypothetical protein